MVLRCLPFLEHLLPWPLQFFQGQARLPTKEGYELATGIGASSGDDVLPSWGTLTEVLEAYPEVPSQSISKARLRLFGEDKKERIILYRDDSGWCPYSEKVWLTLEEKQISYAVRTVNLSAYGPKADWYYDINPKGEVPSIDHENTIVTDSPNILRYIEANFPNHKPLWPAEGTRQRKWIDSLLHLDSDLQAAAAANSPKWDRLSEYDAVLDKYEEALTRYEGPWFFGHEFSGADIFFATVFERTVPLPPYFAGYHLRYSGKWPHVDAWFDEFLTRKSFQLIKSDDYTTVHNRIRALGLLELLPEGASWRAKIDGTDGSWDLPLGPVKFPLGSDDGTGANGAKEEAAKTLVFNHENVANFALRGITGPNASQYLEKVDLADRFVAHALLVGVENAGRLPKDLLFKEVLEAVEFLRDHIGVVRDLTFPAARQLRGHLHWLAKSVQQELTQQTHLQTIRYKSATK